MNFDNRCVQCGYCCTKRPCSYGAWDAIRQCCEFLTADKLCSKYEEIKELEKNCRYPMFDCGCSSSLFNNVREAKIKELQYESQKAKSSN